MALVELERHLHDDLEGDMMTWKATILPSWIVASCSLTQAPRTFLSDCVARSIPIRTASSKLFSDVHMDGNVCRPGRQGSDDHGTRTP